MRICEFVLSEKPAPVQNQRGRNYKLVANRGAFDAEAIAARGDIQL